MSRAKLSNLRPKSSIVDGPGPEVGGLPLLPGPSYLVPPGGGGGGIGLECGCGVGGGVGAAPPESTDFNNLAASSADI